jgi:hypothetical protein
MKYLLTIYADERVWGEATPEFIQENMAAYGELGVAMRDAGVHLGGEGLQPSSTATTVKVRDGETLTTDGPFAETREQLGGYYLLECRDLDDAISWAARIPDATHGTVEVRPVMDYEAMGMPEAHAGSEGAARS